VRPWAEGLSDVQAADAVQARSDWQDALALAWTDPGVAAAVVSEVRQRLIPGQAAHLLVETRRTRVRDQGLLHATGRHRPDATPVLAAVQTRQRLECGGEPRRQARNVLARAAPAWRRSWVPAVGCDRDRQRGADSRLPPEQPAREALAEHLGPDGRP
jgi:transposase